MKNTVEKIAMQPVDCRFCDYISGKQSAHEADRPWLRDADYAAFVSVGALVPGWSLICPTKHAYNLSGHYSSAAFWNFTNSAVDICKKLYGEVRVFEHGACSGGSLTSCGTAHAHLHIVPLTFSLVDEAMKFEPARIWKSCSVGKIAQHSCGNEYLFMSDSYNGTETRGHLAMLSEGTSQFFRRVIANRLGRGAEYNYRDYPKHEIADSSAVLLHEVATLERRNAA